MMNSQLNNLEIDEIINFLQKLCFSSVSFAEFFRVRVDAEEWGLSEPMMGWAKRDCLVIWGALPHAVTRANVMYFWRCVVITFLCASDTTEFNQFLESF